MLDIKFIRENKNKVKEGVKNKGYDVVIVDQVLKIDEKRRQLISEIEELRQQRNQLTKDQMEKGKQIKGSLKKLEPELKNVEEELKKLLWEIPNLPADDVPFGKDESENKVLRKWGILKKFVFRPKPHFELGELLDVIDTKRAGKVSGSRFGYLKNEGVILELALVKFALDTLLKQGFKPVIPPVLISLESMAGMGYLEHNGKENMYVLDKDNLVLVGTSEQSIGPMHKDEILNGKDLPLRYCGFSTCFRREAGSYGKDTRGILRVHQFDKVEMFSFTKPENSDSEHEFLLSIEEQLMQKLKLPYQVVKMCTGDLGYPAARKYDIEVWIPSENRYRETHSTSTCTDFQARRLNIKYRKKNNQTEYVHTLNGTAFAVGRMIIAILENYQQKDGSVLIPEVLQSFIGVKKISPK